MYEPKCDDNNKCTTDPCVDGVCQPHLPVCNDNNPCTNDLCSVQNNAVVCNYVPLSCTICPNGRCINGVCQSEGCSLSVASGQVCPGGQVTLNVTASCWPNCGTMGFDIAPPGLPTGVTATMPFSFYCNGTTYQNLMTIQVGPNAPPGPLTIPIRGTTSTGTVCTATATVQIAEVISVVWDEFSVFNTPLDTCPHNGGKRIFPDWLEPDNIIGVIQRQVNVRAQISPVIEGCMVEFRSWDVDDPFDHNNPSMPNVSLIDGNASGPDNRPVGGPDSGVGQWSDPADSSGVAQKTLVISMQPGNNYRAGASTRPGKLAAVTQAQADANAPPQGVRFTPMLTVWRKLHVEVDSMGAEPGTQIGRNPDWDRVVVESVTENQTTTVFRVRGLTQPTGQLASGEEDHYEGGSLAVPGLSQNQFVLGSIDVFLGGFFRADITTQGTLTPTESTAAVGQIAMLYDDDAPGDALPFFYPLNQDQFIKGAYRQAVTVHSNLPRSIPKSNPATSFLGVFAQFCR